MKALKIVTTRGLLAGSLLAAGVVLSTPVLADNNNLRSAYDNSRDNSSARYVGRNDSRHDSRRPVNYGHNGPVTLRLNYDANGSGNISLQRLLRDQHGIDSNDWRIRSVNVRNRTRRDARADLTIGGRSSGIVRLRRGVTTIAAPRSRSDGRSNGRSDGRWVLGFENAKVRDVAVILEPKANRQGKYRTLAPRRSAYSR